MLTIVKGIGLLLLTLACFSVFSLKFPKGSEAMSGMANAAVASFLVEAVHHYITGDLLGIAFFSELGTISGSDKSSAHPVAAGKSMLFWDMSGSLSAVMLFQHFHNLIRCKAFRNRSFFRRLFYFIQYFFFVICHMKHLLLLFYPTLSEASSSFRGHAFCGSGLYSGSALAFFQSLYCCNRHRRISR